MDRGIDNFFLILELDFIKPEANDDFIKQRIKEKRKEWNIKSEKGNMQQKYRQYKELGWQIEQVMGNREARAVEAKAAEIFVHKILKEEMKLFEGDKTITALEAKPSMQKSGLWPDMFMKLTGLKIVEEEQKTNKQVVDPNPKPDKVDKFNSYNRDLLVVRREDLYHFLAEGDDTKVKNLKSVAGEDLIRGYSNRLKEQVKNTKTEAAVATQTLCAACEEVFNPRDPSIRTNYNKYLIWQQKQDVIKQMETLSGSGPNKTLNENRKQTFIERLTQITENKADAIKMFQQICLFKGIAAPVIEQENPNEKSLLCGYCYKTVDISHGERKCSGCGRDLYISCPKCKEEVIASAQACSRCGFILADVQKVEALCYLTNQAIVNMEFEQAKRHLAQAEHLLQGYDKIVKVKKSLDIQVGLFAKEIAGINALIAEKSFYQAHQIICQLQQKAPTAKIANAILVENTVGEAERLYQQAINEKVEEKLIKICSQLMRICADYPGVETLLLKYRPQAPSNVKIQCDYQTCTNTITWDLSPSVGEVSYKIIRKENTAAAGIDDRGAIEIGVAGIPKFVDTKLEAGIVYYYSIYAIRAGVTSGSSNAKAVNLAEVTIIRKEEGDGYVSSEWKPLGPNAKVDIYRCENRIPQKSGDGKKIMVGEKSFFDDTVENDNKYHYLITVLYSVEGRVYRTKGIVVTLIPMLLPKPVDDLTIQSVENGLFEASWTNKGEEKVQLYLTDKRIPFQYGDVIDISKAQEFLKLVDATVQTSKSCIFRLVGNQKYTIIPVTIKHNRIVIGKQALAVKLEKITIEKMELISTNLRLEFLWPQDAISILVIYGNDGYVENLEERQGKIVRNITKRQFEADIGICLKNIEKKEYYITLYSAYRLNGEVVYSKGTQVLFSNKPKDDIQYSIKIKGLFNKRFEIEFKGSENTFFMPEIDLILKQGGVPFYANSGIVLEHIAEKTVKNSYKISFPVNSISKNSYIRPFFTDVDMNDEINLRPFCGTDFKVS